MPYINWINEAIRLIKLYFKALGIKQSQLTLKYERIEELSITSEESDYIKLKQLTQSEFKFLVESDEGKYLNQILEKTDSLKTLFYSQKAQKRTENFDIREYFKLLEQVQNSGLPEEELLIEEARVELKREKWIKKYNDLWTAGSQMDNQSQSTYNKSTTGQTQNHVKIKTIDILVKEYQTSKELNQEVGIQRLASKLTSQQQICQNWLNKFNEMFNAQGQFEPKGGKTQIQ